MDLLELGAKVGIYFVPFLFALCFHEYAHGWVASLKGDNTAKLMGRLSLNPMVHADILGTFVLPLAVIITGAPIFFGWAKPVPVNVRNLKNVTVDMFWIALAGPLSNLLLALVGAFVLVGSNYYLQNQEWVGGVLSISKVFIQINLALAFFNLIPVHPLDGGKVIARFLSPGANRWMEDNQTILNFGLLFLFISGALRVLVYPIMYCFELFVGIAQAVLL